MTDQDNNQQKIKDLINKLALFMNLECQIEFKEENNQDNKSLLVSVYTPENARFLIGKNGQNLKALEHLIKTISSRQDEHYYNIVVDVNDYKKSRSSYIIDLAKQAVSRVRNTQKAEVLLPMSSYERRIVHMELASYPDVATESIGEEPQRRIVIKPYNP